MKQANWKAILLLVLALATFVGCSTGTAGTTSTGSETDGVSSSETETETAALPDVNYDGYVFRVHCRSGNWAKDLFNEYGDPVDQTQDAIHNRNLRIEAEYGITFSFLLDGTSNGSGGDVALLADDDAYDIMVPEARYSYVNVLNGFFVEFGDLPYVDLSKPWWYPELTEELAIGGKLYNSLSDILYTNLMNVGCMYFNKDLFHDLTIDEPYADVKAGTWTFEKMSKIVLEKGSRDLNGDQEIDIYNDGFGFASQLGHGGIFEFFAQGGNISSKDENGMPVLDIYNDKNVDIISNFLEFARSDAVYLKDGFLPWEMFESQRALFLEAEFDQTGLLRTISGFTYGIIPIPKHDETQKDYVTPINAATNIICVPKTNPDLERTSIILEAWAEDSHYHVIPVYYENALQQKGTMDETSKEMLDLIRSSVEIDMLYFTGGLGGLETVICELYKKTDGDFASYYAANEEQAKQTIAAMIQTYLNNGNK